MLYPCGGPFGIETQADVESVVMLLRLMVEADNSSDAFVIACYSDPWLQVCCEGTTRPVFGIAECGVLAALARAEQPFVTYEVVVSTASSAN